MNGAYLWLHVLAFHEAANCVPSQYDTMSATTSETIGSIVVSSPTAKPVMMLVAAPVSLALAILPTGPLSLPV